MQLDPITLLNLHHQRVLRPANGATAIGSRAGTYEYSGDTRGFRVRCWFCAEADGPVQHVESSYFIRKADAKRSAAQMALQNIEEALKHQKHTTKAHSPPQSALSDSDDGDDGDVGTEKSGLPSADASSAVIKLIQIHRDAGGGTGEHTSVPQPTYIITQHPLPENGNMFYVDVRFFFLRFDTPGSVSGMCHGKALALSAAIDMAARCALDMVASGTPGARQ